MPAKGRARSKSPARVSKRGNGARSTSRARSDAQRKPELKTGHGAAVAKSKKSEPKATVAVKVAKKKRDGENAPVGGGFGIHVVAAAAWALVGFTLWTAHKDAIIEGAGKGMLEAADVMVYAVIVPAYFIVSLVAIQQNNKDLEGWRCSIFNSLLFPLASAMILRTTLKGFPAVTDVIDKSGMLETFGGDLGTYTAPTTLDLEGEGIAYKLLAGRENLLLLSILFETFLVDFGKTTLVESAFGVVKGAFAFAVFMAYAVKGDDVAAYVPYWQGNYHHLVNYIALAGVGLLIRIVYNTQVIGRLSQGTGDAEVVQANLVKAGTHGAKATDALKEKNYSNILIDSKNAHSKKK